MFMTASDDAEDDGSGARWPRTPHPL